MVGLTVNIPVELVVIKGKPVAKILAPLRSTLIVYLVKAPKPLVHVLLTMLSVYEPPEQRLGFEE